MLCVLTHCFLLSHSTNKTANIIKSNAKDAHVDFLLTRLTNPDAHSRVLSYLILAAVLKSLNGPLSVGVAVKILEKLRGMKDGFECVDPTEDATSDFVVLKPSSVKTTLRVRGSLIGSIQEVKFVDAASISWLHSASWVCLFSLPLLIKLIVLILLRV